MPAEMENGGKSISDLGKNVAFKKSPASIPKAYSIKSSLYDHKHNYKSSGSAIEDLFSKKRDRMSPMLRGKDVLNRLDILVAGDMQEETTKYKGILKQNSKKANSRLKKRHIRFPDSKKLQEIIGWDGGEEYNFASSSTSGDSSDEEDIKPNRVKTSRNEELTAEERNVVNLTRRNTSHNAHAPNLLKDNPVPNLELNPSSFALGSGKTKSPPLVTVRPFTSNSSPGKVNKVRSMINGETVQFGVKANIKPDAIVNDKKEPLSNKYKKDTIVHALNSDGGSSESSSPPVSDVEASISPDQNKFRLPASNSNTSITIDVSSSNAQGTPSTLLSEQISSKSEKTDIKTSYNSDLSNTSNGVSSEKCNDISNPIKAISNDNILERVNSIKSPNISTTFSVPRVSESLASTVKSDDYTSVYVTSANSWKGSKEAESVDGPRKAGSQLNRSKTSSVKLTRSSPFTLGTSLSSSILKGTPKPSVVVRKPPVAKDKPKLPQKPTKIVSAKFTSANMNRNSCHLDASSNTKLDQKTSSPIQDSKDCQNSDSKSSETAITQETSKVNRLDFSEVTISDQSKVDVITVNGQTTNAVAECYVADCDVQNALIIDVKASTCDNKDEFDYCLTKNHLKEQKMSNNIDEQRNQSNAERISIEKNPHFSSKNREELLKAIRESLSDKVLDDTSPALDNKHNCNPSIGEHLETSNNTKAYDVGNNHDNTNEIKAVSGTKCYKNVTEKSHDTMHANQNFQATRATIASALGGQVSHTKSSLRQSFTKRQAPKPPLKEEHIQEESKSQNSIEPAPSKSGPHDSPSDDETSVLPKDEHNDSVELNTEESSCILIAPTKDLPPEPVAHKTEFRERIYNPKKPLSPPPPISFKQSHPPPPKSVLVAAARHSSMKSEMSPNRNAIKKGVQFNPETTMVKLPDSMDLHVTNHHNPIKYNRWLKDGSSPKNSVPKVIESSFTGQPIHVNDSPNSASQSTSMTSGRTNSTQANLQSSHLQQRSQDIKVDRNAHLLSPVVTYAQHAPSKVDDELRKWTEKKKKRSKSLPRGSEIDEIMGSSKAKSNNSRFFQASGMQAAQQLMTTVTGASNSPSTTSIRRHSRVELYENDRKQQRKQAAKFSLKKFFKLGIASNPYEMHFPSSHSSDTSPYNYGNKCDNQVQFLDKEHEREIVEREKSKAKSRPEIIHHVDLQQQMISNVPLIAGADHLNGGSNINSGMPNMFPTVELVKITPKSTISPSNNKLVQSSKPCVTPNSGNIKAYNSQFEKNIYNGNNRTAGVNKAGVNKSIISKSKLESYITTNTNSIADNSKNDSGHETSSIHTENSDGSSSSYAMFSSSSGGSSNASTGEQYSNTHLYKQSFTSNETRTKDNTYNSFYDESFNHSRSSSSSNETPNLLALAPSSQSSSYSQNAPHRAQPLSFASETKSSNTTTSKPLNTPTDGQLALHESPEKEQSSSCQNGVSQPSNEDQKNNLTQQSMAASTQLSSSVSSTVEKMDGKSVVSRSRLNSSGRPKPIPPPRSQSLEANKLTNNSKQKKIINANQVSSDVSRKISLPASNIILQEQPSQPHFSTTLTSSSQYQVYANIGETTKTDDNRNNCDMKKMGEIAHSRLSVFQDRNIHDAKNEKDSRKTLTSPYAVSNAMVIDKCEETKGDNNGTKNANELGKKMNETSNNSLPPNGYILPGKMRLGNALNVPALNSVYLTSTSQNIGAMTSSESTTSQRSEVSSSAANFLLSMMAVSSEGSSAVSNSSNNDSSKVSNVSGGTFLGHYQIGSEGANSSERESISPYRSTTDENVEEDRPSSNLAHSELHNPIRNKNLPYKKDLNIIENNRGRSVVHKNLEDNYGAVISANHEALAQLLEQTSQKQPSLGNALCKSICGERHFTLSDFSILENVGSVKTVAGNFYSATHDSTETNDDNNADMKVDSDPNMSKTTKLPVTLLISDDEQVMSNSKNQFSLSAAFSFQDGASRHMLSDSIDCTSGNVYVNVYNRLQVETLEMFATRVSKNIKKSSHSWEKEVSFILLQFINGLKYLQAQGIEEISSSSLEYFLMVRDDKDPHYRIVMLEDHIKKPSTTNVMSLCSAGLSALLLLFQCENPVQKVMSLSPGDRIELPELTPSVGMFKTMCELLQRSSSMALGQVKSMLEYMLWGPNDIAFEFIEEHKREEELQRWLDLERATVLNNLIRTKGWLCNIELAVFEEYHLLFLVQTCAKMLHEASMLFESEVSCM